MADIPDQDVQRALHALLAFGGSPSPASRALKDEFDLDISRDVLKRWRDTTYADRYAALQREHGADIEQAIVRETRDLARSAALVERMAIDRAMDEILDGRVRPEQLAQIALNMAKVKQSNIDKLLALTGRPQQITEHRDLDAIMRALAAKGLLEAPHGDT